MAAVGEVCGVDGASSESDMNGTSRVISASKVSRIDMALYLGVE